jgi:hypothetical protein
MVAQLTTPWQLGLRYVSLINMTDLAFPSHESPSPVKGICLHVWVVIYNLCTANCILYFPYLLLSTYEFPKYIATQKHPTEHKLIY